MKFLLDGEESKRLVFRRIDKSDFSVWLEFFSSPITSLYWNYVRGLPEVECEQWYEKQFFRYSNDLGGMNALVEKESGNLIGHCGLLVQTVDSITELEIGYSLLPQYWNKGYATEAAKKCMDHGFQNNFSKDLISIISITNKPSEAVAIKNRMEISKITSYKDNKVNIFRIDKSKWLQLQDLRKH